MKTPIALVILVFLDVRVTLLFIVNAACSRNCPVTPVQVLVLGSELSVHVPDWDSTSALDLQLFSFLILSMFIRCFFFQMLRPG